MPGKAGEMPPPKGELMKTIERVVKECNDTFRYNTDKSLLGRGRNVIRMEGQGQLTL